MSPRNIVPAGSRRGSSSPKHRGSPQGTPAKVAGDAQRRPTARGRTEARDRQGATTRGERAPTRGSSWPRTTREPWPQSNSAARPQSTREQLLETAGQVFSEKGFTGATGKEICERSGANAAAVVYHFGGMDNLYRAVVQEARSRLAPSEALAAAVARETDAKAKLTAFIGLLVRVLSGPVSSTWAARLMSREVISPTPIFDEMRNKEMRARAGILRSIVSELTQLPEDHPAVARSCINIMAPFGILLLISPQRIEKTFPMLSFGPQSAPEFTQHMVQFALGGLAAIARVTR
jgi:TetR/AcrR family transcriptional regulator, regulator of cefoperazone and chloramphenicol sensitivity